MKTRNAVASRSAILEPTSPQRGRGPIRRRTGIATLAAGAVLALAIGACSPGGAGTPLPISSLLPGSSLPSIDPSAIASAAAGAALAALDQVDAAITANTNATGLTADDAASLTQLTAGARTALRSGDTAAAKTAVDNLATKAAALSAKLNTPAGLQLTAAITALKAALGSS